MQLRLPFRASYIRIFTPFRSNYALEHRVFVHAKKEKNYSTVACSCVRGIVL